MKETLNIFKVTEDLLKEITCDNLVNNMPRIWRYSFYPEMLDSVLEMHELAYHANVEQDKRVDYLVRYLGALKRVESLTRVAHERKMMSHKEADKLSQLYESLSKQATGWKNKSKQATV